MPRPTRAPHACGALGTYRRERVLRIAALLDAGERPAHEDGASILILDREPVHWGGGRRRGLGWIEADARSPRAALADWQEAAGAGVCGLVLDGRRRFLHSAVNGLAPLYWIEEGGAVYFASRIDPLVRTSPKRLSIDWDAWAAIVALRYPAGDRTPFAEIRRLPQCSTLRRRLGRARVGRERWPWTEVEPGVDRATAAEGIAAAVEDALEPLPDEGIVCPLSGGRDSRMLFLPLARDRRLAGALTVPDDEGDSHEEDLAAPVADAFGVPHERLRPAEAGYPGEWEERANRVEYVFVDHAWLVPLARRVAGEEAPVPDGLGIDTFLSVGRHFYIPETMDMRDPRAANEALFATLRRYGQADLALEESLRGPLLARAHDQFFEVARRFEGHHSQTFLTFYSTRTLRGVSTYATKLIGDRAVIVTPGATDAFARAALSTTSEEKLEGALYRAVFEILAPAAAGLPSTAEAPRREPHLPRRWRSAPAHDLHRRSLEEGPLAPHLSPELRSWLDGPGAEELPVGLRLGIEAISMFHAWWRRYRDVLRDVDPADLRG